MSTTQRVKRVSNGDRYIRVEVTPGARKEKIVLLSQDSFRIAVKEKARQNHANRRTRELLAEHFNVPLGKVCITSGHHSPRKKIIINE